MEVIEVELEQPVPLHRRKHPHLDVEDCFGCKAASVRFGGVDRLRQDREAGRTQAELMREFKEDWKRDGIDVKKAGSTSPSSGPLM